MAISATESKEQILDDLAAATDQVGRSVARLAEAFEQLPVGTAERLEGELYRPVQKAYGRGKRTHAGFAERSALRKRDFEMPEIGGGAQNAKELIEGAVTAAAEADRMIAELQDSMLPTEAGDAELRTGLRETREHLAALSGSSRTFLRALGR